MICSNCGNTVDGTKKFCHVCGYPVQQPADENYDSPTEFAEIPGNQNASAVAQPAMADYGYQNSSEALFDKQPKKKNLKMILIPVIAIVLVVAIALGGWGIFLAANPQVRIARALEKTLFSAKSFAVEVSYDGETLGEGYVSFGKTTFTSDFYVEIEGEKMVCNDGMLLMPMGDGTYVSADLPAAFADLKENLDEIIGMFTSGESADVIADELNERFDTDISPEKVLEWAENLIKNKKINEDVIKEIYDSVLVPAVSAEFDLDEGAVPNYKKLKKIISNAFIKGFKGDALKVKDTERKSGIKYYEVEVNTAELAKGMIEYALDCKDLEGVLDIEFDGATVREFLEDMLEEVTDFMDSDDYDPDDQTIEFKVGIKGGYLVAVEYEDFEVTLKEVNKKHDAKKDYEEVEDDADEVIDYDNVEDFMDQMGGLKEPDYGYYEDYDDYYDYVEDYDDYYYDYY